MATAVATTEERTNVPALTIEGERFNLAQRQARMFAMSPLVPDHLRKGSPEQAIANCWIALNLAEAMDEMPLIVMQNIHIINGKAGFASKYMIGRANASGKFKDDIDWDVSGSGKDLSVTCFATLTKSGKRVEMTVNMAMAEAEQWTRNSKYKTMPEVMLRYRSASFLVNMYAPEVMLGYKTAEEIEDVIAAAVPINEPLTSKMLVDQSKPTAETVDEETGEVIEGQAEEPSATKAENQAETSTAEEVPAEVEPEPETVAEQADDHPAQAKADEIIAEINEANAVIDINSIVSRYVPDLDAMPKEIADKVRSAADARMGAIKAAREKDKAREAELAQ